MDWNDLFAKILIGIVSGSVAALVTAGLALKKFYREKWWEKKHAGYSQLLDGLFELERIYAIAADFFEREYKAERSLNESPKDPVDWPRFYELHRKVRQYYILAPILLSNNTKNILEKFFESSAENSRKIYEEGWPKQISYSEMHHEIGELIEAVVVDANRELNFK